MKKRDLFVFSGQSNMMGAAALPPEHTLDIKSSVEYKFRNRYVTGGKGKFKPVSYDCGEFLYCDKSVYPETGLSTVASYGKTTYFVPAMANRDLAFADASESNYTKGACMIPYFCEEYESLGESPIVCHIAKGGVPILHYFSEDMINEYNRRKAPEFVKVEANEMQNGANRVWTEKCRALFEEAEAEFEVGRKIFVWLQGENEGDFSCDEYKLKLQILYEHIKREGFDYFFIVRVGYWDNPSVIKVMNAQEQFANEHEDCYIVTREMSFMLDLGKTYPEDWFIRMPDEKYEKCRDSYYGYDNSHINEKGFMIVAKAIAKNSYRILVENKPPILEEELLTRAEY